MSDLTVGVLRELILILRAQQHADAVVIKCLIAAVARELPLADAWNLQTPTDVVGEQLYAQTNPHAKESLGDFNARLSYWDGIIRSAGETS